MSRTFTPARDPNSPIYLGNPTGISAYADQQTDAANSYLLRLGDATAGLAPPVISPEFPSSPAAPALTVDVPPTLQEVVWTAPDAPAAFTATLDVDDFLIDAFEEDPPELIFDTAPTLSAVKPDAPAVDLSFVIPELSVTLPARPDLLAISVMPFDGITIPELTEDAPELTLVAPSIREYTPGDAYTSSLLEALQSSLQDRIENGGSGLAPDVENAIWERGREREARTARDELLKLDQMESLGYMLPPGVYLDARLKINTEVSYAERGHSREVMIKAAELELDNVKHALTTATQLESRLIDYSNQVEQRLFESSRYATEAGVAIYNARVQAFGAQVDAYRARVSAYEARIRGELGKVEAYKAEIDAENAKAQINRALVDQYRAEIDAALSNVEIFKARVGAIQARAELEKAKIAIFGEQVRAYATEVNAYTAGVEGYRARITAETAKQEAYSSRVRAYTAQVEAASKNIDARVQRYRALLDKYTADWEGYKAAYQGEASRAQAIASVNSSASDAYRAQVQATASYNDNLTKQWQVGLDQAERIAEIAIQSAKANAELYVTTRSLALDAAKVGATVSAQLGAAALNAINWSTSYSNSWGYSDSYSASESTSSSQSTSTNTNYNYSV